MVSEAPPELIDRLARGECVLFLGAGFSRGVTGLDWTGLLDHLAKRLRSEDRAGWDRFDPLTRAQLYVERRGRPALERLLARCLRVERDLSSCVSPVHQALVGLPFATVVTTNYDRLVEATLDKLGLPYQTIIDDADVHLPLAPRARRVVKMHGDLELSDTIILTRDDYLAYERRRPSISLLLRSLLLEHSFFFYGFSLEDPNFIHIFDYVHALRGSLAPGTRAYAILPHPNPLLGKYWRARGLEIVSVGSFQESEALVLSLHRQVEAQIRAQRGLARVAARLGELVAERTDALVDGLREAIRHEVGRMAQAEEDVDAERRRELGTRAEAALVLTRRLQELAIEIEPQDLAALGARLYEARRLREATEALESARFGYRRLGLDTPLPVRQRLGRCYARLGSWSHAFRLLEKAYPSSGLWGDLSWSTQAANELARALLGQGRNEAARRLLIGHTNANAAAWPKLLAEVAPDARVVCGHVASHFARAQELLGRRELALRYATRATELLPGLREAHQLLARIGPPPRRVAAKRSRLRGGPPRPASDPAEA